MLLLFLFAELASASELHLCQESEEEAPHLKKYIIATKSYYGSHAATVAHALIELGIDFTVQRLPWRRCLHDAEIGKYDGIIGIGWSAEHGVVYDFPYNTDNKPDPLLAITAVDYYIYTKLDSKLVWDGERLSGVVHGLAAPRGYVVETTLQQMNAHKPLDSGMQASVSLLNNNRIDGIVMVDLVADQQIAELKRANIARLEPPFYRQPIYMVFSHASAIPDKTRFAIWSQLAKSKIVIDNTP
ncbi:MAG: hypothetical protein KKE94_03445 [Gammaproteobacteria bacterium]|nr:hypothetical protein [Gammaproteobacteria bacterium]